QSPSRQAMKLSRTLFVFVFSIAISLSAFALPQSIPDAGKSHMDLGILQAGNDLPDHQLFDEAGNAIRTIAFRDRYTVLVFGCLT
ncbi:MAG: hypothetical protein AAF483_12665, partial [Planctomycetota bacterium]